MPAKLLNGVNANGKVVANVADAAAEADAASLRMLNRMLPTWAPKNSKNEFVPAMSAYNFKGSNLRKTRAGLTRALNASGFLDILTIGDSSSIGFNGSTTVEANAFPKVMGAALATELGVPLAGSGYAGATAAIGTLTDRWALTGTTLTSQFASNITLYAAATATYTSQQSGTGVEVYYSDSSTAFTVIIDGGAPTTVTPTGTTAAKRWVSGALTMGTHTVKITAGTNYTFLLGVRITAPTGIAVHNLGWGGARAAGGAVSVNWTDTTSSIGLNATRKGAFDLSGVSPDLLLICLGGNDIFQGDAVATAIAGLTTIRGWYPNADAILMRGWALSGTNATNWDSYWSESYKLADTLDVPLVDWRDRYAADAAQAAALGLIGTDAVHETFGVSRDWGRHLASLISAGIPTVPKVVTAPVGTVNPASVPDGSAFFEYTP